MTKLINTSKLPNLVYEGIKAVSGQYDVDTTDIDTISTTTLIGDPLQRILTARYGKNIEIDSAKNWYSVQGTAYHTVIESVVANNPEYITEQRITTEIDGKKITGKPDIFHIPTQKLIDLKTSKAGSFCYNPNGKPEYILQQNIYKYLIEKSWGIKVNAVRLLYMFPDFDKRKIKPGGKYPVKPALEIPVEIMTNEEIEKYIKERIAIHKKADNLEEEKIPRCEDLWNGLRCKEYCSVSTVCPYHIKEMSDEKKK